MADPLAIWGAITGTLALGLNAYKEVRERPKLALVLQAQASEGHAGWIGLEVSNRGRRPTTVVEAGFEVAVDMDFENSSRPGVPRRTARPRLKAEEEPRVLPPGEVTRFRYSLAEWPGFTHADFPLRGYVIDSFSRTTWGPLRRCCGGCSTWAGTRHATRRFSFLTEWRLRSRRQR